VGIRLPAGGPRLRGGALVKGMMLIQSGWAFACEPSWGPPRNGKTEPSPSMFLLPSAEPWGGKGATSPSSGRWGLFPAVDRAGLCRDACLSASDSSQTCLMPVVDRRTWSFGRAHCAMRPIQDLQSCLRVGRRPRTRGGHEMLSANFAYGLHVTPIGLGKWICSCLGGNRHGGCAGSCRVIFGVRVSSCCVRRRAASALDKRTESDVMKPSDVIGRRCHHSGVWTPTASPTVMPLAESDSYEC